MLKNSDQVRESENLSEPKFVPLEAWLLNVNWDTSLKKLLKERGVVDESTTQDLTFPLK